MLKVLMFGRATFELNGDAVDDFISDKAVALFCYLICKRGDHARETLAGLLWGEMEEKRAKANLRQALHNLRTQFPNYLVVDRKTAAFDPTQPHQIDVAEFLNHIGCDEHPAKAVQLYRGEFLQGLAINSTAAFENWVREQREFLRLQLLDGLHELITAAEKKKNWSAVEQWGRQAISVEPWRETFHQQLMLALARQGRFNEAVAQYEQCVWLLEDELGVEPLPETTAVYEQILRARGQVRHNLPAENGRFIGRAAELQALTDKLTQTTNRLITIVGPGGVGKTRLALAAARQQTDQFMNGVTFVPLVGAEAQAPEQAEELVSTAMAQALQVTFGNASLREQLLNYLRQDERLLVLDNFEQLRNAAGFVVELLAQAPHVTLLLTSRERLGLAAETLWPLQGLSYPEQIPADPLRYDALRLFDAAAKRVQPSFVLEAELAAVVEICQLLMGFPLAIELAASWLRLLSAEEVLQELKQSLDLLTAASPLVDDRHQSMRSVLAHSWGMLEPEQRQVMRQMAVFRNGFRREAAEAITAVTLPVLAALADRSFVRLGDHGRYEIHELLRQFAAERLALYPAEETAVKQRHAAYYAAVVAHQADHFAHNTAPIDQDIDNIRNAWQWLYQHGEPETIASLTNYLWHYYEQKGWFQEAAAMLDQAVQRMDVAVTTQAKWEMWCGDAYMALGLLSPADEHCQRALALLDDAPPQGVWQFVWWSLYYLMRHWLGWRFIAVGEREILVLQAYTRHARCAYLNINTRQAIYTPIYQIYVAYGLDELPETAVIYANWVMLCSGFGFRKTADRYAERAEQLALRSQDGHVIAQVYSRIGLHYLATAQYDHVLRAAKSGLELGLTSSLHTRMFDLQTLIGWSHYLQGHYYPSLALYSEVNRLAREVHDVHYEAITHSCFGMNFLLLEQLEEAISHFSRGLDLQNIVQTDRLNVGMDLGGLLLADMVRQDERRARETAVQLENHLERLMTSVMSIHAVLGHALFALLQPTAGWRAHWQACWHLFVFGQMYPVFKAHSQVCWGWFWWHRGWNWLAERQWQKAFACSRTLGTEADVRWLQKLFEQSLL